MNKGHRPSVQSTEPKRSELLRAELVPKLIALKTILDQRRPDASQIERLGRILQIPSRVVIMPRRPQEFFVESKKRIRYELYPGYKALFNQSVQKGTRMVCQKRDDRREKLFAMGIAGSRKRKSPGQGGSYRRSRSSNIVCKKVRR